MASGFRFPGARHANYRLPPASLRWKLEGYRKSKFPRLFLFFLALESMGFSHSEENLCSKNKRFSFWVAYVFLERRIPGKNGEQTPRVLAECLLT